MPGYSTMPDKVVIRLINKQPLDQREELKPREVIVYHWNRILGASFLALALITGLIWGGRHLFQRPDDAHQSVIDQAPMTGEQASTVPAGTPMPQAMKRDEKPGSSKPAPGGVNQTMPKAPALAGKAGEKMAPGTQQQGVPATSERDALRSVDTAGKPVISILSRSIKRAQLTSNVIQGEPVDSIGPTIPMNAKGLIRVYLLMETSGLKGQTLFHDWYWNSKRMAHARIPIKRNSQTAASSKFIDRIMMGPWEVRIVDEKNKVLATTAFEVR